MAPNGCKERSDIPNILLSYKISLCSRQRVKAVLNHILQCCSILSSDQSEDIQSSSDEMNCVLLNINMLWFQ